MCPHHCLLYCNLPHFNKNAQNQSDIKSASQSKRQNSHNIQPNNSSNVLFFYHENRYNDLTFLLPHLPHNLLQHLSLYLTTYHLLILLHHCLGLSLKIQRRKSVQVVNTIKDTITHPPITCIAQLELQYCNHGNFLAMKIEVSCTK